MLSWEFPPRIIGGISSHVYELSRALARKGVDVHVVTCDFPGAPEYEEIDGAKVYRFDSYKIPAFDFLSWVFSMNQNMAHRAMEVIDAHNGRVDVIHAHDWLVAKAAIELKNFYEKPLVSTIHSTEVGRRGGVHNDYQRTINEVEKWLVNESSIVICCSNYMAEQVAQTLYVPKEKIRVIRNGVNVSRFNLNMDYKAVKQRFAKHDEKIVLYVGRLVYEKGVHVLIGAAPKILSTLPNVRFIIIGEGGMKEQLLKEAWDFGIPHKVFFTGFVDEKTLALLYKVSDVCVVPSLYEPFGITALEAMAAQTPVVASDTGGLAEIIEHDKTGVKVYVDNSDSVAWGVLKVLTDEAYANRLRKNAYRKIIEEYNWEKISSETIKVYHHVMMSAPPKSATPPEIKFSLLKLEKYPQDFRLLVCLYSLGAVNEGKAVLPEEIQKFLRMRLSAVRKMLQKLVQLGYLSAFRDSRGKLRYFLTKLGIIKVCALFS
ncbi:MAG: glycosyltransferase [Candidatus Bathyarchaeia archaeon]